MPVANTPWRNKPLSSMDKTNKMMNLPITEFEIKAFLKGGVVILLGGINLVEELSPIIQFSTVFLGLIIGIYTLSHIHLKHKNEKLIYRKLKSEEKKESGKEKK